MPVKIRQNLAETDRESDYKEEQLEEFLDSKGAFCNGNESVDDESYNENNEQQQLPDGFANNCYKIVYLQKLINDFAVCKCQKHCSRTILFAEDVSHDFGNQNYIFQKGTTLFNRSTQNMLHFYVKLHKVYNFTLLQ